MVTDLTPGFSSAPDSSGPAIVLSFPGGATEVRPDARADVRKGDVLLTLVHKGQQAELKSVDQFNKLLSSLDNALILPLSQALDIKFGGADIAALGYKCNGLRLAA